MQQTEKIALNASEVAAVMGVSRPTVYELMRRDDFPVVRIGTRKLVPRAKLEEWLVQQMEVRA